MKLRQILSIVTLTTMAFMVGCGQSETTQNDSSDEIEATQDAAADDSVVEDDEPDESAASSDDESSDATESTENASYDAIAQLTYESNTQAIYSEDGSTLLMTVDYEVPVVSYELNDALAAGLNAWVESNTASLMEEVAELAEMANSDYEDEWVDFSDSFYYAISQSYETIRIDSAVLSLRQYVYEYTCGAHGSYGYLGINFDVATGEQLALYDLMADADGFKLAAIEYIYNYLDDLDATYLQNYGESLGLYEDYKDAIYAAFESEPVWYLDAAGIEIVFNIYEIAPYASGEYIICLPYSEFSAYIMADYLPTDGSFVAKVPTNTGVALTINGTETTLINEAPIYSANDTIYSITFGDNCFYSTSDFLVKDVYLMRDTSGNSFVIFAVDESSADYITYLCKCTNGQFETTDSVVDANIVTVNTDSLTLSVRKDVLGTYYPTATYTISDSYTLTLASDLYTVTLDSSNYTLLTTIAELPVTIDGADTTLPIGSTLRIAAISDKTIHFVLTDDTTGSIAYDISDSEDETYGELILANANPDYYYFEYLPYAD